MKTFLTLLALTASLLAQKPAEKPAEKSAPGRTLVCVDVLMVSVPEDKALQLLPALRDPARVDKAQADILEMVAAKQATLLDWPHVTTKSGQRAVSEGITEERYPIEFDAGSSPSTPADKDAKPADKALLVDAGMVVPTTFETRNTGATLEVEPVISKDGSMIDLQVAPQMVRFLGMKEFSAGTNAKGEKQTVGQPIFQTRKASTNITLLNGQRLLVYVGKPSEPAGQMDFFIIGARILEVPLK